MKRYIGFVVLGIALLAASPVTAQEPITPTATITITPTVEWSFPEEGLHPYTYSVSIAEGDPFGGRVINRDDVWKSARVALTVYTLLDLKTWGLLALVIIIPVALGIVYGIFVKPPEI